MHEYSVRKENNVMVLVKDGMDAACPFQQSLISQNENGGVNIMRMSCTTHCALAEIETVKHYDIAENKEVVSKDLVTELYYVTNCGSCSKRHKVSLNVNKLSAI